MALSLEKGKRLSLEKTNGSVLNSVRVKLGWVSPGEAYDADASALLLDANDKCIDMFDKMYGETRPQFCFYGQEKTMFIESSGDDLGDGDEGGEELVITLKDMPAQVVKVPVIVTLHKAKMKGQSLAELTNGSISLYDNDTQELLATGKMASLSRNDISLLFLVLVRQADGWKVELVNQGYDQDIAAWVELYKVNL